MGYSPNVKPSVLMSALLQITIETDDTTDKLNAPMVPSWNLWLSLIFPLTSLYKPHLDTSLDLSKYQFPLFTVNISYTLQVHIYTIHKLVSVCVYVYMYVFNTITRRYKMYTRNSRIVPQSDIIYRTRRLSCYNAKNRKLQWMRKKNWNWDTDLQKLETSTLDLLQRKREGERESPFEESGKWNQGKLLEFI